MLSSINNGSQLRSFLLATKGQTSFETFQLPKIAQDPIFLHSLESVHLIQKKEHHWLFPGYAKVRVAIRALQLGESNRLILTSLTWQEFEEFVAQILSAHGFQVRHRFRYTTTRRYEIDILAGRQPVLFCIDCKQYGVRLGKAASLRTASEEQFQRTQALARNFVKFQADLGFLDWPDIILIPMLVTLLTEDIQFHDRVPIIPASLFNAFLLGYEEQMDTLCTIQPNLGRQQRLI